MTASGEVLCLVLTSFISSKDVGCRARRLSRCCEVEGAGAREGEREGVQEVKLFQVVADMNTVSGLLE